MSTLNYGTFVSQIANIMAVSSGDSNFTTFMPGCIDYAEQRIYRDTDLLYNYVVDSTAQASTSSRNLTIPSTFIVIDSISIFDSTASATGTRTPLTRVSRQFLDNAYPASTTVGTPEFYAILTPSQAILGPTANSAWFLEVSGEQRPTVLSSNNSSTILTQYVPDLFMAAAMVYAAGYMRDFGSQSDDPRMSQSWEAQYTTLLKSASVEQFRAKAESEGWTTKQPAPTATPQRV